MFLDPSVTTSRGKKAFENFVNTYTRDTIDYSNAVYVNMKTPMELTCKICGHTFNQKPDGHKVHGCPSCAIVENSNKNRSNREEFISKAKLAHGDKYDYSKVDYVSNSTKVTIICPVHGEFQQIASAHIGVNASGCRKCSQALPRRQSNLQEFIVKAIKVHSDLYNYSKAEYINSVTPIVIVCKIHGEFTQTPVSHVAGADCPECAKLVQAEKRALGREEIVNRGNSIHNSAYDYKLLPVNIRTADKGPIICPTHGVFNQLIGQHILGRGCPSCNSGSYDPLRRTMLYYLLLEHNGHQYYKIGITARSVEGRYTKQEMEKITILHTMWFSTGAQAYSYEQTILNYYKCNKYYGEDILLSGNTEILTKPVNIELFI